MYRSEMPRPSATTMPMKTLAVWVVLASQAPAAHSARMNAPITIAETIVKTVARFKKKPTSMSRRLRAAYVRAIGVVSNTSVNARLTTIVARDDDEVAKPMTKKQKTAASGTSV